MMSLQNRSWGCQLGAYESSLVRREHRGGGNWDLWSAHYGRDRACKGTSSQGCEGSIPSREQLCRGDGGRGHEESHSGESLPSAQRGRDEHMGRETEWKPCPLHITQQSCFVPSVILVSSTKISGCRIHHSHPLGLSPCSQQQSSPWVCSPNPTFEHPAPVHINRYMSQAGTCRAMAWTICVCLILLRLPQTSCWALLQWPLNILFCLNWSPHHWEGFPRCGNLSSP